MTETLNVIPCILAENAPALAPRSAAGSDAGFFEGVMSQVTLQALGPPAATPAGMLSSALGLSRNLDTDPGMSPEMAVAAGDLVVWRLSHRPCGQPAFGLHEGAPLPDLGPDEELSESGAKDASRPAPVDAAAMWLTAVLPVVPPVAGEQPPLGEAVEASPAGLEGGWASRAFLAAAQMSRRGEPREPGEPADGQPYAAPGLAKQEARPRPAPGMIRFSGASGDVIASSHERPMLVGPAFSEALSRTAAEQASTLAATDLAAARSFPKGATPAEPLQRPMPAGVVQASPAGASLARRPAFTPTGDLFQATAGPKTGSQFTAPAAIVGRGEPPSDSQPPAPAISMAVREQFDMLEAVPSQAVTLGTESRPDQESRRATGGPVPSVDVLHSSATDGTDRQMIRPSGGEGATPGGRSFGENPMAAGPARVNLGNETGVSRPAAKAPGANIDPSLDGDVALAGAALGEDPTQAGPARVDRSEEAVVSRPAADATLVHSLESEPAFGAFGQRALERLAQAIRRGEAECRLELHPKALGHVHAAFSWERQTLSIFLSVENEGARQAVAQALPELRQAMEDRGIALAQCDVGYIADGNSAGGGSFADVPHQPAQARDPASGGQPPAAGREPGPAGDAEPARRRSGLVDVMV